jgi:hypothetical protein
VDKYGGPAPVMGGTLVKYGVSNNKGRRLSVKESIWLTTEGENRCRQMLCSTRVSHDVSHVIKDSNNEVALITLTERKRIK